MVDPTKSLQSAGRQDGDDLTAVAIEPKLAATDLAVASFCCEATGLSHGAIQIVVVTALKSKISSMVSSRFKQLEMAHLLQSWQTG